MRGQRVRGRVQVTQVRGAIAALRGAHAQEVDVAERARRRVRRGETEPAGLEVLAQQRLQARLEERHLAARRPLDLVRVHVDGQDLMPEVRQADGVRKAEISGPDNGDGDGFPCAARTGIRH